MKVLPRADRVLLKMDKARQTFAGGELLIVQVPELNKNTVYKHTPQRGEVLAVGPSVESLEVGDYVICTPFNGVSLPSGFGRDLKLLREEFVLLVLDEPDALSFGEAHEGWPGDRRGLGELDEEYGPTNERV